VNVTVALSSKTRNFGSVVARPDGTVDFTNLQDSGEVHHRMATAWHHGDRRRQPAAVRVLRDLHGVASVDAIMMIALALGHH
jgi:hypothetical protein